MDNTRGKIKLVQPDARLSGRDRRRAVRTSSTQPISAAARASPSARSTRTSARTSRTTSP
ncbi:MAG: hypothetical protein ACLR4Z_12015 [Butyricicoccaceae bacterium]